MAPGGKARAGIDSFAPIWGHKLAMPHFYKREKLEKFERHWQHRLGLETLKMKHAVNFGYTPTEQQRKQMQAEIGAYVESCYEHEELRKLDDLYVTDHQPIAKKYTTVSEEEDQDFFDYQQSVEAYNADVSETR